jgi:hypothetical protein
MLLLSWKSISPIKQAPFNAEVVFYKTLKPPNRLSSIAFYNCPKKKKASERAVSFCSWQNEAVEREADK